MTSSHFKGIAARAATFISVLAFALGLLVVAPAAHAADISVGDSDDLQAALTSATSGDTVIVSGTHTGDITINQTLTLQSDPADPAHIVGSITLAADGVTVDGLDITNPSLGYGIVATDHSNLTIENNTLHDIGTTLASGSVQAIYVKSGSADVSSVRITGNHISNIGSTNLTYDGSSGSAKGIFIGDSNGSNNFNGVTISNNDITNVSASGAAWTAGRGAYGILVNHSTGSAATNNLSISGNTISHLDGLWAHAIGLEGNTPGASVTNNTISLLTDHKTPSDSYPVTVQDNAGAATISFSSNTLDGGAVNLGTSTVLVDGSYASSTAGTQVQAANGGYYYVGTNAFSTIAAAVSAVSSGGTVNVAAGTYPETVSISKAITFNGAQVGVTGNSHSGAESIVTGVNITNSNVTVDGFSFGGAGSQVNVSSASSLSGVAVKNNVFSGYSNVGLVTSNAGNILIQKNVFKNPLTGSEAMQIKANSDAGGCTGTQVLNNVFIAATDNSGADINLSCTDSNSSNVTVSGNSSTGNTGGSSFVAFSGVADGITVSNNTATTDGSSIFFFGSLSGSALINKNVITNSAGSAVSIHGADNLGTDDVANTGTFTITNNTFTNNFRAVSVAGSALGVGAQVVVHKNNLSGNTDANVANASTISVDAANNWWGTTDSAEITAKVSGTGTTNFSPWYTTASLTTLTDGTVTTPTSVTYTSTTAGQADLPAGATDVALTDNTVIDLSNATTSIASHHATIGGNTVTLTQSVVLQSGIDTQPIVVSNSNLAGVTASIPDGTTIQAPAGWDGTIAPPTSVAASGSAPSGFTVGSTVITLGSPDVTLVFDKAVTILLLGVTGPVGYKPAGSDTWTQITTTCGGTFDSPTAPTAPGECDISDGIDTKILTYHFTSFGGLNIVPVNSVNGGQHGSSGGSVSVSSSASTPSSTGTTATGSTTTGGTVGNGQVLGASTFNFTRNLTVGFRGDDVTQLQTMLIAEGYLNVSAPTGYFGALTKAAVIKHQKAHGIPGTGFVGPMTLAQLNAGVTPTSADESASVRANIQAQINALQVQLAQMIAASSSH